MPIRTNYISADAQLYATDAVVYPTLDVFQFFFGLNLLLVLREVRLDLRVYDMRLMSHSSGWHASFHYTTECTRMTKKKRGYLFWKR